MQFLNTRELIACQGEKKTFNKVEIAEFDDDEKIDMLELKRSIVSVLTSKPYSTS